MKPFPEKRGHGIGKSQGREARTGAGAAVTPGLRNMAPSLGQILLAEGVVTSQQLENGVQEQRRTGLRLGETLVGCGACTELDIAEALARQLDLEVTEFEPEAVDRTWVAKFGSEYLRKVSAVPLKGDAGAMRLAVSDPFDVDLTEEVRRVSGLPVEIEVATRSAIQMALDALEDRGDRVQTILENARERAHRSGVSERELLSADEIVRAFIAQGVRRGSADVHVEPEDDLLRVRYRIDGILQPGTMIPKELESAVVACVKILANLDIAERRLPQDGRASLTIDGRKYDLRVSIIPTVSGETCVMRVLDSRRALLPQDRLGMREDVRHQVSAMAQRPHGMFLVTGPTGSGKSTTLYGMLSEINLLERKVVTVEDPVEYRMPLVRQVPVRADLGLTFAAGLRSILRQDPDVILVGEIRDMETASVAVQASMTGHLVLSTLHTNSAAAAITRLTDLGLPRFLIAATLRGVVAQRLVRRVCERCATWSPPSEADLARLDLRVTPDVTQVRVANGCAACSQSGYHGRIAIHEALALNGELRRMILADFTEDAIQERAAEDGFISMRRDGQIKAIQGLTTLDEVDRVAIED